MDLSSLWIVYLLLALLMGTLTWVGWKYFYRPVVATTPRPAETPVAPTPAVKRARPRLPRISVDPSRFLGPFKTRGTFWLLAPVLLAGFTVAFILTFSHRFDLDPLTAEGIGPQSEVAARLGEEKLVPPPDLPPSLFTGTERPNLESADRDWRRLDAGFSQVILKLFAKLEQRGYPMALLEGYRSPERQEMLADKGPSVTNARAYQSKHQYGLAADIAPIRNGKLVISERDPWAASAYQALGEEAEALGLTWGGRWPLRDLGHVENAARLSTLKSPANPS